MRCVAIGIERRGRFVHQQNLRPHGERPGDAQALLLPAREGQRRLVQAVLHFVPQRRVLEAFLDAMRQVCPVASHAVDADAVRHVLENRLRKRIRFLEHHADAPSQIDHVGARAVDVLRRRSGCRLRRGCPMMMSFIRFRVRRNVLLPHPDGPMNADTWLDAGQSRCRGGHGSRRNRSSDGRPGS